MRISTRGQNAIKLMLDLATYNNDKPVKLRDIAKKQTMSEKTYLSVKTVVFV